MNQWTLAGHLAWRDPLLLLDYGSSFLRERLHPVGTGGTKWCDVPTLTCAQGEAYIAATAGTWSGGPALAHLAQVDHVPTENSPRASVQAAARLAGDTSLGWVVYALTRALRPSLVVETGVATGVTSAYILAALSDNDRGILHSIDLPQIAMVRDDVVGAAVPADLRHRWVYHWGSAHRLLPGILRRGHTIPLFVHDSDHRYDNMRWELECAWQVLPSGGWLVADDVHLHTAMADVAAAVGVAPIYVEQERKQWKSGLIGLLRKPQSRSAQDNP